MKRKDLLAVLLGLASIVILTVDASAMYNPRLGRFMQRDPIGTTVAPAVRVSARPAMSRNVSASRFAQRDPQPSRQHADGMSLYQYVGNNPINWVDTFGNKKVKPGKPGIPPTPSPTTGPAAEPPAGRGATCGIKIKRSAICKLFGQSKPSDYGHEWTEIPDGAGGTAYADFPSGGRSHPYIAHHCHRYERANPMWIWNAHVRFFGGSLPSGKSCGEVTCSEIRECMLRAMDDWAKSKPSGELEIPYEFRNRNCIHFVNSALSKCCMARGVVPTRVPKPFEELKSCCEREKDMDSMPGCNDRGGRP